MGSLNLPVSGAVYVDTAAVIYSVERIAPYAALLQPLWDAASIETFIIITSELTLLETLVKPLREHKRQLADRYRRFLTGTEELAPQAVTRSLLNEAAQLRAIHNLKTPDAIHAATARLNRCSRFITNDPVFRRVPELNVVVLDEHLEAE